MNHQQVIRRPIVTEKTTLLRESTNVIVFEVHRDANKIEVRRAIEALFSVKVAEVRLLNVHGKARRLGRYVGYKPDWRKAYVRLKEGEKAPDFFEGV